MNDYGTSMLFRELSELDELVARAEKACEYTDNRVRQHHDIVATFQRMIEVGDTSEEPGETSAQWAGPRVDIF